MSIDLPQSQLEQRLLADARGGRISRRQLIARGSAAGLSMTVLGSLLSACGGTSKATKPATAGSPARRGGTLRVSSPLPAGAIDPVTMFDGPTIALVQAQVEYLAWVEPDLTLRPVLATKWTPSADARTWVFALRKGVKFSDGRPFGAEDVTATFDRLTDPKSESAALSNFAGILAKGGVKQTGPYEVTFELEKPFADFPYIVASANYNAVILPRDYAGDFAKRPVGTGPFVQSAYAPKRSATLRKNPNYWQEGLPYLDSVQFRFAEDVQAEVLGLQGGEADLMVVTPLSGTQALAEDPRFKFSNLASSGHNALHMRTDKAPFDDIRVRQALSLAIDREQFRKTLYAGRGTLGNDTVFAPAFPVSPKLVTPKQDIAKAKQLLAAAGHANGFKATLSTERASEIPQEAALYKQAWKAIGVDVELDVQSQASYYGSGNNQPWLDVDLGLVDWASRAVPAQYLIPAYTSDGIWNAAHFDDPTFDGLVSDFDGEVDKDKRAKIANQLGQLQAQQVPAIIPIFTDTSRVYSTKVRGPIAQQSNYLDLTKVSLDA